MYKVYQKKEVYKSVQIFIRVCTPCYYGGRTTHFTFLHEPEL